jgi:hypothetical protein
MKVVIAGSRTLKPFPGLISYAVYCSGFEVTEVVCGNAAGIDSGGAAWAAMYNVPVTYFKPDWDQYGKRAGYLRNQAMVYYADAVIAIVNRDSESKGTYHTINIAKRRGIPIYVLYIGQERFNEPEQELAVGASPGGILKYETREDVPRGL